MYTFDEIPEWNILSIHCRFYSHVLYPFSYRTKSSSQCLKNFYVKSRVHLEENSTSTIMKTAQVEENRKCIAEPLLLTQLQLWNHWGISDDNFITKTKSYSKKPKNNQHYQFEQNSTFWTEFNFNRPKCCTWVFPPLFCSIKIDLSGNTVFKKIST